MSQENVEGVRRAMDALNERDIPAVIELFTTDAVIHEDPETAPDAADFFGHVGVDKFFRIMFEAWDELRIDELDFTEVDDKLVVTASVEARGRGSEVTVRTDYITVYEMRGGKVARMEIYFDRAKALEAVGLRE